MLKILLLYWGLQKAVKKTTEGGNMPEIIKMPELLQEKEQHAFLNPELKYPQKV